MNDDFFTKFYQSPRPEFTQSLYLKLTQDAKAESFIKRPSVLKRIAFAFATACLMIVLTMVLSPTIRVAAFDAVESIIAKITVKGTTVLVNSDEPPTSAGESGVSYSEIWTPVSPKEISTNYSFFARLPTWVPTDYRLQERAALYYGSMFDETPSFSLYEWKDNVGETIQLRIMKGSCPNGPGDSTAPTSDCTLATYVSLGLKNEPQVVAVNGEPAVYYTGVTGLADLSGSVRKWNPTRWKTNLVITKGATMIWESIGRTFILSIDAATISKADLIHVAESIP